MCEFVIYQKLDEKKEKDSRIHNKNTNDLLEITANEIFLFENKSYTYHDFVTFVMILDHGFAGLSKIAETRYYGR